jgi:L-lactate dehydrogenase
MSKIAIIGAGAVGSAIAYVVMLRGLTNELVLVDKQTEKAMAEQMDLNHGAMFVPKMNIVHGDVPDCAGAQVVVMTAGTKFQAGQSAFDLARANAGIFRKLIPEVMKVAPDARLLIVSNPVDLLTELARRLSGLPSERVFGVGTALDTSRFRFLLGQFFGVAAGRVHAYIIGESGDHEVPVWSSARIGNVQLDELRLPNRPPLDARTKRQIFQLVRENAVTVVRHKGAPTWATGLVAAQVLEALLRDEGAVFTVTRLIQKFHGVTGVCLSLPHLVTAQGASAALDLPCSDEERRAFLKSATTVGETIDNLGF